MGRGGRGRSRQRLRNARERAHRWWDRDAHWAEMGYTPEDAATKRRVVAWCWVVFVALTALMCAASRTFEPPAAPLSFSPARCAFSGLLAAAVCFSLVTDAYRNPPSLKGSAAYAVGNYLGPYAFFTKHALTIQCSHGVLSFLGELLLDGRLVAMTHAFACFSAVVGIALTVLFLKLNWFEETWRKEVLHEMNKRLNFTEITLAAHLPSLPVALLDVFLAKRPDVYPLTADAMFKVTLFASLYPPFYGGLTCLNFGWSGGHYPYPFMRSLKKATHWLAFTAILEVLLNGVILPGTFFLMRANPT
jgi:hypothetical protein